MEVRISNEKPASFFNYYITSALSSFTYKLDETPVISGVSPDRGGTGGGTKITISGKKFRYFFFLFQF